MKCRIIGDAKRRVREERSLETGAGVSKGRLFYSEEKRVLIGATRVHQVDTASHERLDGFKVGKDYSRAKFPT